MALLPPVQRVVGNDGAPGFPGQRRAITGWGGVNSAALSRLRFYTHASTVGQAIIFCCIIITP